MREFRYTPEFGRQWQALTEVEVELVERIKRKILAQPYRGLYYNEVKNLAWYAQHADTDLYLVYRVDGNLIRVKCLVRVPLTEEDDE